MPGVRVARCLTSHRQPDPEPRLSTPRFLSGALLSFLFLGELDPTRMLATVCLYCKAVVMADPQLMRDLQKRSDLSGASWV